LHTGCIANKENYMTALKPNCLPTIIGSMPHTDPEAACNLITRFLKDIPVWPQLPQRAFQENMYAQYSEGFPGVEVSDNSIQINASQDLSQSLEQLYTAYLENDTDAYPISPEYAAGLNHFLSLGGLSPLAVKGQVTGPVTWGLTVADENRRAVIYDDFLGDAVAKLLKLKASWQEKKLRKLSPETIIFIDEPYMAAYGSVGMMLSREKVVSLLNEVFEGISGLKGIHCCGNTDWGLILETNADIINYDTYHYAQSLSLYPAEVKAFLARGGIVAWGIVPSNEESLAKESEASLQERLEEAMSPFTGNGISFKQVLEQAILTPSCGLGSINEEAAAGALELLAGLSDRMRKRYL
jgi:methionine synthase II (cobalamin-independent)